MNIKACTELSGKLKIFTYIFLIKGPYYSIIRKNWHLARKCKLFFLKFDEEKGFNISNDCQSILNKYFPKVSYLLMIRYESYSNFNIENLPFHQPIHFNSTLGHCFLGPFFYFQYPQNQKTRPPSPSSFIK